MTTQNLGTFGETLAKKYLDNQGYTWHENNYRSKFGEIDIIVSKDKEIVFCEVKTRRGSAFGRGIESVDFRKLQKIIKTIQIYLAFHGISSAPWRLDVIEITILPRKAQIRHHKDVLG
ncbi:MAG: YraN family protein [Patescibacteria group bacterium]